MPADLKNAFGESCCDGGACSGPMSAQNCGCDPGMNYHCSDYPFCSWGKFESSIPDTFAVESVVGIQATEDAMRDTVPAMSSTSRKGTNIAEVKLFRNEMHAKSMAMIDKKGADYNRDQQQAGDTLFNLRVCEILGVVPSAEEGILVRLSDKLMRLISLTKPGRDAAVKDESVLDTIADIHNYVDYLGLIWQQRRNA